MGSALQPHEKRGVWRYNSKPSDRPGKPEVPPSAIRVQIKIDFHRLATGRVEAPDMNSLGTGQPRCSDGTTGPATEGLAFDASLPGPDPGFARHHDLDHIHVGATRDGRVMAQRRREDREVHLGHRWHAKYQLGVADPSEARGHVQRHGWSAQSETDALWHADADTILVAAEKDVLVIGEDFHEWAFRGSWDS